MCVFSLVKRILKIHLIQNTLQIFLIKKNCIRLHFRDKSLQVAKKMWQPRYAYFLLCLKL